MLGTSPLATYELGDFATLTQDSVYAMSGGAIGGGTSNDDYLRGVVFAMIGGGIGGGIADVRGAEWEPFRRLETLGSIIFGNMEFYAEWEMAGGAIGGGAGGIATGIAFEMVGGGLGGGLAGIMLGLEITPDGGAIGGGTITFDWWLQTAAVIFEILLLAPEVKFDLISQSEIVK